MILRRAGRVDPGGREVHRDDRSVRAAVDARFAAQRFRWQGTVDGDPVITAAVNWLMGEEHLDPPWDFGPEGQRFEIAFDADPPLSVTFHGIHPATLDEGIERNAGIVATAMHCVNAVPYVCAADPGIKTYLDLPLIAGRAPA